MPTSRVPRALADAATVHAVRRQVMSALGLLAASPLDEFVAQQMRGALDRVESAEVREAIRRLGRSSAPRPPLRVVSSHPPSEAWRARRPVPSLTHIGGAA